MLEDFAKMAFRNITRRKMRSWLTMLGIFIGIAAVVTLISLGQGFQGTINEQFEKLGPNRLIITPGNSEMGFQGGSLTTEYLTDRETEIVRKTRGIRFATGLLIENARIDFNDEVAHLNVIGVKTDSGTTEELERIGFFEIETGRQFSNTDGYAAILGQNIAKKTFDRELRVGNKILINDVQFKVIGIQKTAGTGVHDAVIRIPLDTAREIFDEPVKISEVMAATQTVEDLDAVVDSVERALRKYRDVKEGEEDFSVQTSKQIINQLNQILTLVNVVFIGIAAISLIVGGIGITNTMYTSVLERTKEIGIMKSVGARNSDIRNIFLMESGFLGLVGGIIGAILGLMIAKVGELIVLKAANIVLKPYISIELIAGVLLFSFLIGALSGTFPAMQAAKMNPVECLRGRMK